MEEVILLVLGKTFKGGFHVHDYKELSKDTDLKIVSAPDVVAIPLVQHIGNPAVALVKKGDQVKLGEKIGEADGFISASVHSSVSGKVLKVEEYATQRGRHVQTIFIENDGKNTLGYEPLDRDWKSLSEEEIVHIIKEAGITGLGGASFPTHVKVSPPPEKQIDSVIINAAECEPYLTADDITMRTNPQAVVEGLLIIKKAVGAKEAFITIEDNKPEAVEALRPFCDANNVKLVIVKTKYPQGDEKRIIDVTLNRVVPQGKIPADVGVVVNNVSTAKAIYDAVRFGKPLYERIATITGHGAVSPTNALIPIGTPINHIVKELGGLKENAAQIILGGPMMGKAIYSDEFPFEKSTNGLLIMTTEETVKKVASPCIKCNRCAEVCPVRLVPYKLEQAVRFEREDMMQDYDIMACIECGSCSYICPASRPLVESIIIGKNQLRIKNS